LPLLFHCFFAARVPPRSTLFPYTTLFRSIIALGVEAIHVELQLAEGVGLVHRPAPDQAAVLEVGILPVLGRCICFRGSGEAQPTDRKSTRLNSSHQIISYAVFCWQKTINV